MDKYQHATLHEQLFKEFRPKWSWLPAGINLCTIVTPAARGDLEATVLKWIYMEATSGSTNRVLKNGDIIVSEEYKEGVVACINARTGQSPRNNRPRLRNTREVPTPHVALDFYDLDELRLFARELYLSEREDA